MNWEEKFEEFKNGKTEEQLYEEKYGPIVGPYLCDLDKSDSHGKKFWLTELGYRSVQSFYEFDTEGVPVEIQKRFLKEPDSLCYVKLLDENLKSYDAEKLHKALEKRFGYQPASHFQVQGGKKGYVYWYPVGTKKEPTVQIMDHIRDGFEKWRKTKESFDIQDIAQFYGYTISRVDAFYVTFEATYPEDATDYVSVDCRGFAYHVVNKSLVDSILKSGLRAKNGPSREGGVKIPEYSSYRYFPKRVYLYATPTRNRKDLFKELEGVANQVSPGGWENAAVFQAYVKDWGMYWDTVMDDEHSVFTYHSIPPEFLKRIK